MKYSFKFSIIIAVYNAEKYIGETIESVINQNIDFHNNVEIILVDDGSTDNSSLICKKYVIKYPNNIKYFYKENGGVSSARNLGIKQSSGKYLNFLDSDDLLHSNALKTVYNFFEKNKYQIDLVTLPIESFEKKEELYERYIKFGKKSHIVDLNENPQNYIFSCAASFYKRVLFETYKFNTNLKTAEDLYLNTKLFLKNQKFGIISPTEAVYYYRKRLEETSITNTHLHTETWLIDVLEYLYSGIIRNINKLKITMPEFIKNIFIYNIEKRIHMPGFIDLEVLKRFLKVSYEMLKYVDDELILNYHFNDYSSICLMFMLKNKQYNIKKQLKVDELNNICINNIPIENIGNFYLNVSSIVIKNRKMFIYGFFNEIISSDFKLYLKSQSNIVKIKKSKFNNTFLQKRYLNLSLAESYVISMSLPLEESNMFNIIIKTNNKEIPINIKNAYSDEVFSYETRTIINNKKIKVLIDNTSISIEGDYE